MKKLVFAFSLILLCLVGPSVLASDIFSYSFEKEDDAILWSGGIFDDSNPFESGFSIFVNNPFGEVKNQHATHVLDYDPMIELEGGKVYTISGYVMNPLSSHNPSVRTNATLGAGANTILVSVSGIGDEWAKFSTTFYAGEGGSYNLSIRFADGYVDFGFFVDELSLKETPCMLSTLNLAGPEKILIPATGSIKSYLRPYLLTSDSQVVDIISTDNVSFDVPKHPGISFNPRDFAITVTSQAQPDTSLLIGCTLRNFANLSPTSITVTLTDNMIDNPGFDTQNMLWTSTADIVNVQEGNDSYISVSTNDYGDYGYFVTLTYDTTQILLEDVVYVVRARVKSDSDKPFSAIYAKNSAENADNTVYFNIKDISGTKWLDLFVAFVPEKSGVYTVALNLCSMYDCNIYIDDISLSSEVLAPEYITLHAPGNIALANEKTNYPVSALLRDQLGNILPSEDVCVSLKENTNSLYYDDKTKLITVFPDTISGKYTLVAKYKPDPSITAELDFTVSFDFIGDGTFENTIPNEWWMVSSPYECDFYMRHDGSSRRALINCKGGYFLLLNNSYVHLQENMPYVLNTGFSAGTDCTATVFTETLDGEIIPLAQVFIPAGTTFDEKLPPELFLSEKDTVGRLLFYIQSVSGQPFTVYADNLSMKNASVVATNLHIDGAPFINSAVSAEFSFFNNVAENTDTSACMINWYVTDAPASGYSKFITSGRHIYFDTTFLNKYVYFEVIPICPVTGFSSNPIRSMPFLVMYDSSANDSTLPMFTPALKQAPTDEYYFTDIHGHWAEKQINALAYSNVVVGKSDGRFAPEDSVTRAEFAKMLSIAFSINSQADFLTFNDVSKNDWFYRCVTSLKLSGIVQGTAEDTFSPYLTVSREEALVMLTRLYEKATGKTPLTANAAFKYEEIISPWAYTLVKKAVTLGIVKGNPDGYFEGKKPLTRAEAATIILRLADKL